MVYTLLDLATEVPKILGAKRKINISQEQLARASNVVRPRVNEVLKRLETEGLIALERSAIFLLDEERLGEKLNDINLAFVDPRKTLRAQ